MPTQHAPIVIIGAGASGLFCASRLAKLGKSVLVLDHANKAGKKILMSGGGRCNFTNLDVTPQHFLSQNPHFVRSALAKFTPDDFLTLVYEYGVEFFEKELGQLFCTHSSKEILNLLLSECEKWGVEIRLNCHIHQISQNTDKTHFCLEIATKNATSTPLTTETLIIATGGLSIPTMGATGFGYEIAKQFGHAIVPTTPSLVPFTFTDRLGEFFYDLSGVSLPVVAFNAQKSFELPLLFTHRGLSGPAILQLSNYWTQGESIYLNLLPKIDASELLIAHKKAHPKQKIARVFEPFFTKKLLSMLAQTHWQGLSDTPLGDIKDKTLADIGQNLNAWQIKPAGSEGYRVAEVTKGGVDTRQISSKTMESTLVPNLYFIGEVLDVTGHLGGYNFQWAWSSANACAVAIAQK